MGHRALVAYRRPDRTYELRYSHWGGERSAFGDRITVETPLADGAIDDDPLAESVPRDRILTGYLDPCVHEALYLVDPADDYRVSAYRVCWLEWDIGRDGDRGAIVAVDGEAADRRVRTWFRATKTALADVVEMGALSRRAARAYLEARVCEDEDGIVYTYVDAASSEGEDDESTDEEHATSTDDECAGTSDSRIEDEWGRELGSRDDRSDSD